nr:MAG TPA: hypothetical protein [Caudoviricetes sp.]
MISIAFRKSDLHSRPNIVSVVAKVKNVPCQPTI